MKIFLAILLFWVGCTPPSPNFNQEEVLDYQSKLKKMDEELLLLDQKIKLIRDDMGLKDELTEKRELLNSRRARLVEIMKTKKIPVPEKSAHE